MTDLICFDCDGVLVDSERLAAQTTADLLAALGVDLTWQQASQLFTGKHAADAMQTLHETYGLVPPADYQQRFDGLLHQKFRAELRPVPGINTVLAALDRPCCVTSNSGHARLALSLSLTGLDRHFGPHVFSAEDVARGKPAPDLFHHAAARLGADIRRCVVIDDSVTGILGAVAAGATAIGFTGGSHGGPDLGDRLRAAGACCVVDSATGLIAALDLRAARAG